MKILIISEINSNNLGDRAIYLTLKNLLESYGHKVSGFDLSRCNRFYCEKAQLNAPTRKEGDASYKSRMISIVPFMPNFESLIS